MFQDGGKPSTWFPPVAVALVTAPHLVLFCISLAFVIILLALTNALNCLIISLFGKFITFPVNFAFQLVIWFFIVLFGGRLLMLHDCSMFELFGFQQKTTSLRRKASVGNRDNHTEGFQVSDFGKLEHPKNKLRQYRSICWEYVGENPVKRGCPVSDLGKSINGETSLICLIMLI